MANRRVVLPLLALAAPLCFTGAWYGAAVPRTVPRAAEAAAPTSGSSVALVKVTKEKLGKVFEECIEMMVFSGGRATTMMRMRMGLVVMVIVMMDGMRMVTAMVKPCPRVFTSKFCSIPFCNVAYLLDIDLMTVCYDPLGPFLWLIPKLLVKPKSEWRLIQFQPLGDLRNTIATAGVLGGVTGLLFGGFWLGAASFVATSYLAKKAVMWMELFSQKSWKWKDGFLEDDFDLQRGHCLLPCLFGKRIYCLRSVLICVS